MRKIASRSLIVSFLVILSEEAHFATSVVEKFLVPVLPTEMEHMIGSIGSISLVSLTCIAIWHGIPKATLWGRKMLRGLGRFHSKTNQVIDTCLGWLERAIRWFVRFMFSKISNWSANMADRFKDADPTN
jgi:hypothetical protein